MTAGNCTRQVIERTGDPPWRGAGSVTVINPKADIGTAVIHTEMDGKPEKFNVNQKARSISADCDNVRR